MDDSLVGDSDFWYKLKVDEESVPDGSNRLSNLILEFFKGRKSSVESIVGDASSFAERATTIPNEKLRETLFSIYIDHLWNQSKSGPNFKSQDGRALQKSLQDVFGQLTKDGIVVQKTTGGFVLVYHIRPALVDESDAARTEVHGRKLLAAETSLLHVDGASLEMRGTRSNLAILKKKLSDGGIEEVKPILDSKPIISSLNTALEHENPIFDVIGIKYTGSNLPSKSKLMLQNTVSISEDIRHLGQHEIIIPNAITDISRIYFRFKKLGKTVKLKVKHRDEGFEFEIDDKKLTSTERKEIKQHLEQAFGISFDRLHDYAAQYDERFIFHKILARNVTVYDKYYHYLKGPVKKVLDQLIAPTKQNYWKCPECERENDEEGACPHCGADLEKSFRREIEVNDDRLFTLISDKFENLKGRQIEGLKICDVKLRTLGNKLVLNLILVRNEYGENHSISRNYSFFGHPLGEGQLSHRVNEYMLDAVLVAYGSAAQKVGYNANFGVVDLHNLIKADDAISLLREAVDMSLRLKERRLVVSSIEARQRLERLVKDDEYTDKHFERDVFFVIKRMFPYSERWGREFKREADGAIVFGDHKDEYFVASYDPKFTKAEYYDLDSEEQNKAVFYILDENANTEINSITKMGRIDAHILISNMFKESQLMGYHNGVKKFMRLTKGHGSDSPPSIVFLPLDRLLDIYRIYENSWAEIKGNVKFHKEFFELITRILSPTDGYKLLNSVDISTFESGVIALKDRIRRKSTIVRI
ncbi:MAG: hypothetical protein ACREBU_07270 [Nitrososphaera sp.]